MIGRLPADRRSPSSPFPPRPVGTTEDSPPVLQTLAETPFIRRSHDLIGSSPENGQGLTEYALIISLVVVVVLIVLAVYGPSVGNLFSNVVSNF